mmetsp:Transcript_30178/g.59098  ORF Transcript_30178/g.59098 Transcript_30178/m.59098 type:complete len:605 (-) Transcript_30178:86-1900(-)
MSSHHLQNAELTKSHGTTVNFVKKIMSEPNFASKIASEALNLPVETYTKHGATDLLALFNDRNEFLHALSTANEAVRTGYAEGDDLKSVQRTALMALTLYEAMGGSTASKPSPTKPSYTNAAEPIDLTRDVICVKSEPSDSEEDEPCRPTRSNSIAAMDEEDVPCRPAQSDDEEDKPCMPAQSQPIQSPSSDPSASDDEEHQPCRPNKVKVALQYKTDKTDKKDTKVFKRLRRHRRSRNSRKRKDRDAKSPITSKQPPTQRPRTAKVSNNASDTEDSIGDTLQLSRSQSPQRIQPPRRSGSAQRISDNASEAATLSPMIEETPKSQPEFTIHHHEVHNDSTRLMYEASVATNALRILSGIKRQSTVYEKVGIFERKPLKSCPSIADILLSKEQNSEEKLLFAKVTFSHMVICMGPSAKISKMLKYDAYQKARTRIVDYYANISIGKKKKRLNKDGVLKVFFRDDKLSLVDLALFIAGLHFIECFNGRTYRKMFRNEHHKQKRDFVTSVAIGIYANLCFNNPYVVFKTFNIDSARHNEEPYTIVAFHDALSQEKTRLDLCDPRWEKNSGYSDDDMPFCRKRYYNGMVYKGLISDVELDLNTDSTP